MGANIGFYSFLSTLAPDVEEIHSFEAIEATHAEFKKNINLNNLDNTISSYNLAASDKEETLTFLVHEGGLSGINSAKKSTFHSENIFSNEINIEANALDNLFKYKDKIIGLKVDVEGHEESVLRGSQVLLGSNQCIIQIESYAKNKESLKVLLESFGYFSFLVFSS